MSSPPTGYLHLGHARTFWVAHQRARAVGGELILRNEDLDRQRAKPEFVRAMFEDLRWLGLSWDEGPDVGGTLGPYSQSERQSFYLDAWRSLGDGGFIYPCTCSRKDLERALEAPHDDDDEPHYPGSCRSKIAEAKHWYAPRGVSWRFKVPDGETIKFVDRFFGAQQFTAGGDFSDFLIWRRDDIPSYQLAVVVDDAAMRISEVVRGADLLKSAARQILLFRALGCPHPQFFHCPLLRDERNVRLAKRHDSLSLRSLREQGTDPASWRKRFAQEIDWGKNLG
jgi:glutamyl-tRNA synthetase